MIISKRIQAEKKWNSLTPMERVKVIYLVGANKISGIKGHRLCVDYIEKTIVCQQLDI